MRGQGISISSIADSYSMTVDSVYELMDEIYSTERANPIRLMQESIDSIEGMIAEASAILRDDKSGAKPKEKLDILKLKSELITKKVDLAKEIKHSQRFNPPNALNTSGETDSLYEHIKKKVKPIKSPEKRILTTIALLGYKTPEAKEMPVEARQDVSELTDTTINQVNNTVHKIKFHALEVKKFKPKRGGKKKQTKIEEDE